MDLRRIRAGDLLEHPSNWRTHPARQRQALLDLLGEIGYADALLARETEDGLQLIDGHLRQSLDEDQVVPVLVLDLSAEEAELLLATLDPLASLAGADPDRVAELQASVQTSSDAVRALLAEIARSAGSPTLPVLVDSDDIPEVPRVTRTKPGDLWLLGKHRVLCADARQPDVIRLVAGGENAQMMWTDPPYGVEYAGKTRDALTLAGDSRTGLADLLEQTFASANEALAPGSPLYVAHPAGPLSLTFLQAFLGAGWGLRQTLVWSKDQMVLGHGDYHYRHEPILYGYTAGDRRRGRGQGGWFGGNAETSVFEVPRPKSSVEHPTAKPVELVRRCLQNSSGAGGSVLDPFLGSGTTLVAAEQLGRRALGVEIDPRYVDVAIRRWERLTGKEAQQA